MTYNISLIYKCRIFEVEYLLSYQELRITSKGKHLLYKQNTVT